ncbi:DUF2851 family protein [Chryseobacterium sp.]|uniref:DUF2851 family protein n=1 Tax=Chryseobacterium sp. TaxID=1871047 RepID=UPI0025B9A2BB|nr:DUF2851 family protein [Chryseobacterium sp.]
MTEKLLQYLWNFKVFKNFDFKDIEGNPVEILDSGQWNTNAGPDFLTAKIRIKGIILAGNIELHLKSSDWIFHNHSQDPNYQNIILHVVYHHDVEIPEFNLSQIPTLELKNHIDENKLESYKYWTEEHQFISCEKIFTIDKVPSNFHEKNLLKKLNEKTTQLENSLQQYKNDFEAVLFHNLAYSFGLKVNASLFRLIAESIDFKVINKIRQNHMQLEALLFGLSGWLENPVDEQTQLWKKEFEFIKIKFNLPDLQFHPKFLRLRPPNFPTIRLSQLAHLYSSHQNLFSKLVLANDFTELMNIFKDIHASEYWNTRFTFGKISEVDQTKTISREFIELLLLNTILPVKYVYHQYHNEDVMDAILQVYRELPPEKNTVINQWKKLGMIPQNALESQSLIYHNKNYCEQKNCLNCDIGFRLLKEK